MIKISINIDFETASVGTVKKNFHSGTGVNDHIEISQCKNIR
jgi:hypothetical protein